MAAPRVSIDKSTQLEVRVFDEQYEYIKEHFGRLAADSADYGCDVSEIKDGLRVSTRVQNHGILISVASFGDIKVLMLLKPFE